MITRRSAAPFCAASVFAPAVLPGGAFAQAYPRRTVRLIIPLAPGAIAVRKRMVQIGLPAVASTPAELGAHLKSESELWAPVIKTAGIKSED